MHGYVLGIALTAIGFTLAACDSDGERRPLGANCTINGECESGVCGGGTCLDPDLDSDGDRLLNGLEAALGTNPVSVDSDGDGKGDFDEVGDISSPGNFDGDNKPDAAESSVNDEDSDCISDERDPFDSKFETDLNVVADLACCCDDKCSNLGLREVTITATCTPPEGGGDGGGDPGGIQGAQAVLSCTPSTETTVRLAPCGGFDAEVPTDAGDTPAPPQ